MLASSVVDHGFVL